MDAVVEALYDLSLDLFHHHLLGSQARYPVIVEAWKDLLPQIPRLIAREPAKVAGSITNALYNLARTPGARPDDWTSCVTAFRLSSVQQFLDAGAVAAWRCGLPQYRESALQKAISLPPQLAAQALKTEPEKVEEMTQNLKANPWTPNRGRDLKLVAKAGAFRGFAGQFLLPPKVQAVDGMLIATDGDTMWRLHADLHNTVLQRHEPVAPQPPPLPSDPQRPKIKPDGTISWQGEERRFPELAKATSLAAISHTLAVTIPTSHHLFLVALA